MKRITALFLSILLLLSLCVTALGHEAPDLTKKGTITIQWKFQGDALPDGALRAYRVGTLKDTDGNFSFAPLPAYQGKDLSEKNLTPELAKELAGMVKASSAIKPASFKSGVVTVPDRSDEAHFRLREGRTVSGVRPSVGQGSLSVRDQRFGEIRDQEGTAYPRNAGNAGSAR